MARNIIAVIAGILIGSVVNLFFVSLGYKFIPLPEGGFDAVLETKHLLFPFIAHAAGTLAGALAASLIAVRHRLHIAVGIGAFFLLGGIAAVVMIAAPLWFEAVDLIFAYIPMAWLGWKIAGGKK